MRVMEISSGTIGSTERGEGELHRAAHLSAVDARAHDRAEGAHVEEVGAHPIAQFGGFVIVLRIELGVFRGFLVASRRAT